MNNCGIGFAHYFYKCDCYAFLLIRVRRAKCNNIRKGGAYGLRLIHIYNSVYYNTRHFVLHAYCMVLKNRVILGYLL